MSFRLTDDEREDLERLVFELETSRLPLRVHAARLLLFTKLYLAVRDLKLPPRAVEILRRIPRLSDKQAWDRLSEEERREAGIDALEEELKHG